MVSASVRVTAQSALTFEQAQDYARMAEPRYGFLWFLPHWTFRNRETGEILTFADLWPGQRKLAELMAEHPAIYALKAGKLGFSELACAYDGWVARFGQPNARVHLFSRNGMAARELLDWVKFGLLHLPAWLRLPVVEDQAGANTSTSIKLLAGEDDVRTVVSYASGPDQSIDQTCTHLHADEFTRWQLAGASTWSAALSSVSAARGSCHIVTRGNGRNWAGQLFLAARDGKLRLPSRAQVRPFFAKWDERPDRTEEWYEEQKIAREQDAGSMRSWAPVSWQDALTADAGLVYPMFEDREGRHIVSLRTKYPLPTNKLVGVGLDPGGGNPTAMVLKGLRASGATHQYGEFYRPNATVKDIALQLDAWCEEAQCDRERLLVATDGSEPVLIATLQEMGFAAFAAEKDRDAGIRLEQQRLERDQMTCEPSCVHTIDERYDYRWAEESDARTKVMYAGERPVKHHADAMDADRYIEMAFAQWEPAEPVTLRTGRRV